MKREEISLEDLALLYRKVKMELCWWDPDIYRFKLAEFEEHLKDNLLNLKGRIEKKDFSYFLQLVKSVDSPHLYYFHSFKYDENSNMQMITTDRTAQLEKLKNGRLILRVMFFAPIEIHIFTAYWIEKVGDLIDKKIGKHSYGGRLKRTHSYSCSRDVSHGEYDKVSPNIYVPYYYKYSSWREEAFKAVRKLHEYSDVFVITMDITNFYHSIDPEFFLQEGFYKRFGIPDEYRKLHETLINVIKVWNRKAGFQKGIPIGMLSSYILANAYLYSFDKKILEKLNPYFYGRYVDDIILVIKGNKLIKEKPLQSFLFSTLDIDNDGKFNFSFNEEKNNKNSKMFEICLNIQKQRFFFLSKEASLSILESLEREINELSSARKFLPDLIDEDSSLLKKVFQLYTEEDFSDNLRKIDDARIRKLGMAILLSKLRELSKYLPSEEWKDRRRKLYLDIRSLIFEPSNFFANFKYVLKLLQIMILLKDYNEAFCLLEEIGDFINLLGEEDSSILFFRKGIDNEEIHTFKEIKEECSKLINKCTSNRDKNEIKITLDIVCKRIEAILNNANISGDIERNKIKNDLIDNVYDLVTVAVASSLGCLYFSNEENQLGGSAENENTCEFQDRIRDNGNSNDQTDERYEEFKSKIFSRVENSLFRKLKENMEDYAEKFKRHNLQDAEIILRNMLNPAQFLESIKKDIEKFELTKAKISQKENTLKSFIKRYFDEKDRDSLKVFSLFLFPSLRIPIIYLWNIAHELYSENTEREQIKQINKLSFLENVFKSLIFLARGQNFTFKFVKDEKGNDDTESDGNKKLIHRISIPCEPLKDVENVKIAIANVSFEEEILRKILRGKETKNMNSYNVFKSIINSSLKLNPNPHYLVLPELSFPKEWLILCTKDLYSKQISIISGGKYVIKGNKVYNPLYSLLYSSNKDDKGQILNMYVLFREDKLYPSPTEENLIKSEGYKFRYIFPKLLFTHGNFKFANFICFEVSDLELRTRMRGKVDCLFIISWNRDINYFNSIIEATSRDVHCYVVQANNGKYGDSRIRAPYREDYKRDIIKLKGGHNSYVVIAPIDVRGLREFHSQSTHSEKDKFKPTPPGFSEDLCKERRMWRKPK